MTERKIYRITWGNSELILGQRTCIMGTVNVTPDSFSDGGQFFSHGRAVDHGKKLAAAGADILDVGGESTRPYSEPVSLEEETRRVVPVIKELAAHLDIPISIDTAKAEVARHALDAGASIINDISALRLDPEMPAVAAEYGVPIILMHMLGTPKTMQADPTYNDLLGDITDFFKTTLKTATEHGIPHEKIIIDPGIGFGKTFNQNLLLLKNLEHFRILDAPILVGPSRKAFIRNLLKSDTEKDISPQLPAVETGTQAAVATAVLHGAHIVRVHDAANTLSTIRIIDAILDAKDDREENDEQAVRDG